MKWYLFNRMAEMTNVAGNVNFTHSCVGVPQIENGVVYGTYKNPYAGLRYESNHPYTKPKKCFYAYLTNKKVSQCALFGKNEEYSDNYIWNMLIGVIDDTSLPAIFTANGQSSIVSGANIQGKREWKTLCATVDNKYKSCYIPVSFKIGNQQYIGMYFFPMIHNGTGFQGATGPSYYNQVWFYKEDGTYTVGYSGGSYQLADREIDFGTLQEIPEIFYNWIMNNSDVARTAKITIKSFDGKRTLAQTDMIAPFTSVTITNVDDMATIRTNNSDTLSFTLTELNREFAGLSKHALSVKPLLRSGRTSELNVDSPITLYECYGAVVPVPSTYGITFYHSSAEPNRCDKTNYLTSVLSLTGTLREGCSVMSPAFNIIADDERIVDGQTYLSKIMGCNYCYIPKFGRYYFITDISNVAHNVWRVAMSCDVLHTFWGGAHGINSLQGIINRTADSTYVNDYIQDDEIMTEVRVDRTYDAITNGTDSFDTEQDLNYNILLQVFGND